MKKIRHVLSAALIAAAIAVPAVSAEESMPFKDIDANEWYYDAVSYVYEANLFNGTSSDTFEPDTTMTRAMFVQILANKTSNYDASEYTGSNFSDVSTSSWYAPAVEWANSIGLVTGTSSDAFEPQTDVTREQMATILYRYADLTDNVSDYTKEAAEQFVDWADVSEWAQEAVAWSITNNVINGDDIGQIAPKSGARRCQVAQVFKNAQKTLENDTVNKTITYPEETSDSLNTAKQAALNHAGLTASNVTFTKEYLYTSHGKSEYKIEFYVGKTEYEYKIDANTGTIISYDIDN